nr:hypothetical protein BaRGS_017574 [Batillaria attramentaria]
MTQIYSLWISTQTGQGFYKHFPLPRLKLLDEEVEAACGEGLVNCVRKLATVARTSFALQDTDLGLKMPWITNEYHPFETALDLFRFRKRDIFKSYLKGKQCLEGLRNVREPFGQDRNIIDYRKDDIPFQCAILAFCPVPVVFLQVMDGIHGGLGNWGNWAHSTPALGRSRPSFLSRDPGNPCRGLKDSTCDWDFGSNRNFVDLQRNRFNITCQCAKEKAGFEWNSKFHLCVEFKAIAI